MSVDSNTLEALLTVLRADRSTEDLRAYFDVGRAGIPPYTGASFEALDGGGTERR